MRLGKLAGILTLSTGMIVGGGLDATAQAPFETDKGRLCLEGWITAALGALNGYDGPPDHNAGKLYYLSRFGLILRRQDVHNYNPDDWAQYGANRDTYMWLALYRQEEQYPYWKDKDWRDARVPGLRYFVRNCVGPGAGGTTAGGSGGTTGGTAGTTGGAGGSTGGAGAGAGGGTATGATVGAGGATGPASGGSGTATGGPGGIPAVPATATCPKTLSVLSGYPGVILGCTCPAGFPLIGVWGSGPYTHDSNLCAAALHAGAIPPGGGPVWVQVAGGQPGYTGTTRNGVTTTDYGAYNGSMSFPVSPGGAYVDTQVKACPATATQISGTLTCHCAPSRFSSGGVWGTGVYTYDSNLCNAALHAGVVGRAGGSVTVRSLPGQQSYASSTSNGISSQSYGAWRGSIEFLR